MTSKTRESSFDVSFGGDEEETGRRLWCWFGLYVRSAAREDRGCRWAAEFIVGVSVRSVRAKL